LPHSPDITTPPLGACRVSASEQWRTLATEVVTKSPGSATVGLALEVPYARSVCRATISSLLPDVNVSVTGCNEQYLSTLVSLDHCAVLYPISNGIMISDKARH